MYLPSSTYRIQFFSDFKFKNFKEIIDYLDQFGISTVYASPITKARSGSTHGYDVADPDLINPEIGSLEEFEEIGAILKERNIGWLQDIVPNHMVFSHENRWLNSVFSQGSDSAYYDFFDINWNHHDPALKDKLMVPFLGATLQEVVSKNELKLEILPEGFCIKYYDNIYPVHLSSYQEIFDQGKLLFDEVPSRTDRLFAVFLELNDELEEIVRRRPLNSLITNNFTSNLYQSYLDNPVVKKIFDRVLDLYKQDNARLQSLLEKQYYRLFHWQETEKRINYRRFFTINDLICLKMENEQVFRNYHDFTYSLFEKGLIQGLRIDHIDGLFNPSEYLKSLRKLFGQDLYLVVEKILEWEEALPLSWPIQGTTGYSFMASVSHLFTNWRNKHQFTEFFHQFSERDESYEELVLRKKYFILKERMGGELNNLYQLMLELNLIPDRLSGERLKEALAIFLVCHSVYRIYPAQYPLTQKETQILESAIEKGKVFDPGFAEELDLLHKIFTEYNTGNKLTDDNKIYFLMRCEQFSGPLEAKGVEDTSFYLYSRLISHNEVGDTPEIFGISHREFHERMRQRMMTQPHTMNASATHDTKRGEDARIRINVLSEMPQLWPEEVMRWEQKVNHLVTKLDGKEAPTKNDRYFLYQTLVGAYPFQSKIDQNFKERIKAYMIKVLREGKENSSWASPNEQYELSLQRFIDEILAKNSEFLTQSIPFFTKVKHYGIINSLSQVVLKTTCPGIPDIYQGCELWDTSLVDPDNRRPVNYQERMAYLNEVSGERSATFLDDLMEHAENGKIKFYILWKILQERRKNQDIFDEGAYIPLEIEGKLDWHAIAYIRQHTNGNYLVIAPRHLTKMVEPPKWPLGEIWGDSKLVLPEGYPIQWENILTGEYVHSLDSIKLSEAFADFPVVVLKSST